MGMSTHVVAVRAIDDQSKFDKMIKLKEACDSANVSYPQECIDFFDKVCDCGPAESVDYLTGQAMNIDLEYDIKKYPELAGIAEKWNDDDMCSGFEIDITKIPSWIKKIRVYNAY